ncbi:MAG: hypothetical protein U0L51_08265 [Olegusella sp.]|nr:hypothetical protein [Olegusella sp.]
MAVKENTATAADTCESLDVEFVQNFREDYDKLTEVLGLFDVQTLSAGAALYQYKITGALNTETPAEGDETPLSNYKVAKDPIGEVELKRYAKLTTAEAILKGGLENAVLKADRKMAQHLRSMAVDQFFTFLAAGTGKVSGTVDTLQKALAKADAAIGDAMEKNNDAGGTLVHYVNRQDAADYLGEHEVTMQTAFGLTYLESFLGAENVILTSSVKAGTVIVTPVENIHPYAVDFAALSDAGLEYESDDFGIIGVHHVPDYNRGSVDAYAALGLTIVPEVKDYIVNATFKTTA